MTDGDDLKIGQSNYADHETRLSGGWKDNGAALDIEGKNIGLVAYTGLGGQFGVLASSPSSAGAGISGASYDPYGGGPGVGVFGQSVTGPAIQAASDSGPGVYANSNQHAGVYAYSLSANAVYATSGGNGVFGLAQDTGTGVIGLSEKGFAGAFYGPVVVTGDLAVIGAKSAAVRLPGGLHRLLYSMESPESWFEDFGTGTLVKGKAQIRLARDFVSVVRENDYHIFLTPLSDCNGLYISSRSAKQFEVREQMGGRKSLKFSYRVVARRKDVYGKRGAKIRVPVRPRPMRVPKGIEPSGVSRMISYNRRRSTGSETKKNPGRLHKAS